MGLLELLLGDDDQTTQKFAETVSPSPSSSPADGETGDPGGGGAMIRAQVSVEEKKDRSEPSSFPHCPRCLSYALYRPNNVGSYECQTCELKDISEEVARRVQ